MNMKIKGKKGFISIDMIVVYAILTLLGISIIALYVSKGQDMTGDSSQKMEESALALNEIPLNADGSVPNNQDNTIEPFCFGPKGGNTSTASTKPNVVREKVVESNTYYFI